MILALRFALLLRAIKAYCTEVRLMGAVDLARIIRASGPFHLVFG